MTTDVDKPDIDNTVLNKQFRLNHLQNVSPRDWLKNKHTHKLGEPKTDRLINQAVGGDGDKEEEDIQ